MSLRWRVSLAMLMAVCLLSGVIAAQSNVLILVADDVGVDNVGAYEVGSDLPATPNVDKIAQRGVLFRRAWANPLCSPTRATLMAGRYGFQTGVGKAFNLSSGVGEFGLSETTLPELLDLAMGDPPDRGAFGKWHLGDFATGGLSNPNLQGWPHFSGSMGNLVNYFAWWEVVNGVPTLTETYATTRTVDRALEWIATAEEPWVCYVAFNAPHAPFHAPPPELHSVDLTGAGPPNLNPRPYYKAMVEAMDTEIGRLLVGLGPAVANTTVVFLGDNGTPAEGVTVAPFDPGHAKGTVYDGGVNVPLIISGPLVQAPGAECLALVNTTDLFATVARIYGVDSGAFVPGISLTSRSLLTYLADPFQPSQRKFVYAESFSPNGPGPYKQWAQAIRGDKYKLIKRQGGCDELYDLSIDPFESNDLFQDLPLSEEEALAYLALEGALASMGVSAGPTACPPGPPNSPPPEARDGDGVTTSDPAVDGKDPAGQTPGHTGQP